MYIYIQMCGFHLHAWSGPIYVYGINSFKILFRPKNLCGLILKYPHSHIDLRNAILKGLFVYEDFICKSNNSSTGNLQN